MFISNEPAAPITLSLMCRRS